MDHMDHMNHGGGGDSGGGGDVFGGPILPSNTYMQRMYWATVGSAIALATFVNILNRIIYRQRLAAAANGHACPAKPLSFFFRAWATLTAVAREVSYESIVLTVPIPFRKRGQRKSWTWASPLPNGPLLVILTYLMVLVIFCFYKFNLRDQWEWEDVGYRTGFISLCQLPLLFLLAGKKNVIGYLTGSSYERLNWLHRWAARGLFLTATIHMGYWFTSWERWHYIATKVSTDPITRKGLGAWAVLFWIVLSSVAPIRGLAYEVFVLQHLVSFIGFLVAVYLHIPAALTFWIWIPVGLFAFDRLVRFLNTVYINLSIFRRRSTKLDTGLRRQESGRPFWACKAEFTPYSDLYTRITIRNPPISWKPGQHVFLACHSLLPGQSHPFTISSLASDGKMEFLVRAEKGATRKFLRHAQDSQHLPVSDTESASSSSSFSPSLRTVAIEGPYGGVSRPLCQFDTVTLVAGSTGATFTIPLLQELIQRWSGRNNSQIPSKERVIVTRRIRFIWTIRDSENMRWFEKQLEAALAGVKKLTEKEGEREMKLEVQVFITCDENVTEGAEMSLMPARHAKAEEIAVGEKISIESGSEKTSQASTTEKLLPSSTSTSTTSSIAQPAPAPHGCSSDSPSGCCCRAEITDLSNPAPPCCCAPAAPITSSKRTKTRTIKTYTGRPPLKDLIRTELEHAIGESAVVVCGPTGLVRDVRMHVARLSDERAVHKGTGALGVWVWGEGFSY